MKVLFGTLLLFLGQILAWFQSNAGVIYEDEAKKMIFIASIFAPLTTICFAFGTKFFYEAMESLWAIRFITFGIGYMIFIPLTWYYLGEEIFTIKNAMSLILCIMLIIIQTS